MSIFQKKIGTKQGLSLDPAITVEPNLLDRDSWLVPQRIFFQNTVAFFVCI